jgi:hypothetical protein
MSDSDAPNRARLRRDSDELLAAIDEIKRLEREKRTEEMSSPRFHEMADEIEQRARAVFRYAADELEAGEDLSRRQGQSIDSTEDEPDAEADADAEDDQG